MTEPAPLEIYRARWMALFAPRTGNLRYELVEELAAFLRLPLGETVGLIDGAKERFAQEWREQHIDVQNADAVVEFYSKSEAELYELVEWYGTDTPEHYFLLRCAEILNVNGAKTLLDYGSGIGTAAIVFGSAGIHVTIADVSERLLSFATERCQSRNLRPGRLNILTDGLPQREFDAIACLDVLEHVPNPIETLRALRSVLKPGGILFLHAPIGIDPDRPMHIMHNDALFRRIRSMGFDNVWDYGFPTGTREPRTYRRADRSALINRAYFLRDGYFSGRLGDMVTRLFGGTAV